MPNCFSLTRKTSPQAGPVSMSEVDNEICAHLGVEPWPDEYYHHWYGTIGLSLACGQSFDQIIQVIQEAMAERPESIHYYETKLKIAEYLKGHFISDCWAEIGRN